MIKNVIIVNDFNYIQGGASKVAVETANLLSKSKEIKVYFFSGCGKKTNELNSNIIDVCTTQGEALHDKNKLSGVLNGIYNFKAKKEFKKLLTKLDKNQTIIHIHGWTKSLSSSIFDIAFKMHFKVILTLHDYFIACPNGGYYNYKKNTLCDYIPLSKKCIMCNCDSRNYIFKIYRIIRHFVQNKIVKINNRLTDVITISNFSENILKRTLNKNINIHKVTNPINHSGKSRKIDYMENKYYLFVGRISREKGADIFCQVINDLNLKGIVVGDGPELEKLKEEYKSIQFVGWKKAEEVKEYMQGARALIFPSRVYETMGLVPLEAMQYGIPVITSNCNAAIDYISDKNLQFDINNLDTLKKAIKYINNNKIDVNVNLDDNYNYEKNIIKTYNDVLKNMEMIK